MILSSIYTELIYRPLFNLLVAIYDIAGQDVGVAIILLTVLVRLALYKVNSKAIKGQRELQEIQPEIKEIQRKYKDDQQKQAQKLMEVYQKRKVSPFSGCLPLLIQFPIIIALYQVFLNGFRDESLSQLYSFVPNPGHLNTASFIGVNLAFSNIPLAAIASVLQFYQTKTLMAKMNKKKADRKDEGEMSQEEKMQDFAQSLSKNMMYAMPILTFVFAMSLPSGLALYWSVSTLFAIVQQYLIIRKRKDKEERG